jgi:hypothetical protein
MPAEAMCTLADNLGLGTLCFGSLRTEEPIVRIEVQSNSVELTPPKLRVPTP